MKKQPQIQRIKDKVYLANCEIYAKVEMEQKSTYTHISERQFPESTCWGSERPFL